MNARVAVIGQHVATPDSDEALLAQSLRDDGWAVTVIRTGVLLPVFLLRLLRLARVDIAHVFWGTSRAFLLTSVPAMLAARFFGKRVVLHCHRREAEQHLTQSGWLVHPWLALADEIVVPTEAVREAFARFGHRGRVINNVVDLAGYAFRLRTRSDMHLLCVRDLEPAGHVETVVEAFAMLKLRYSDATLSIVGSGSDDTRLRTLAGALNVAGIRFLGRVEPDRLQALFSDAAFCLHDPAADAAAPVTCLRAFASGARVVSAAPTEQASLLRDGANCLVVPREAGAFAAAVSTLVEDGEKAAALARQAREDAARYTWPAVRDAWAASYARVAAVTDAEVGRGFGAGVKSDLKVRATNV